MMNTTQSWNTKLPNNEDCIVEVVSEFLLEFMLSLSVQFQLLDLGSASLRHGLSSVWKIGARYLTFKSTLQSQFLS